MNQIRIYCIVVTYNGIQWIDKCLDSLQKSSVKNNIIVIDNHSTDDTPERIQSNYPDIEFIKASTNLGFGKGNNIGLKKAVENNADYVFLLNQDAWLETTTLQTLIEAQKSNPAYGVLSPVQMNGKGNAIERKFEEYAGPVNTPGFMSDIYTDQLKQVYTTRFVNAAAWLISKDCLKKVGLFNPIFPHYGEDEDFLNRVDYHGIKVGIVPAAIAFHDRDFSWEKIKGNFKRLYIAELIKLVNINITFRSAFILFLKTNINSATTALLFRKFETFKFKIRVIFKVLFIIPQIIRSRKFSRSKSL